MTVVQPELWLATMNTVNSIRIVFTEGGKGGVGKTEVAVCLATWYHRQGIRPKLIDFGAEASTKGCLQSFLPEAVKLDAGKAGALDHFFSGLDDHKGVVLADMNAGAGATMREWIDKVRVETTELNIRFTAVCVTTNDPDAIHSVLQSAKRLQDNVDYLIVLNRLRSPRCDFRYWHQSPEVAEFVRMLEPTVIEMRSRDERFQAEVRNHALTLEAIANRKAEPTFFRYARNAAHARHCLRQIYGEFEKAAGILLPSPVSPKRICI
ncbi:MAG: MinD-like ATPase involved in chromosome partitioning or flagellar assembly [Verrucomicrobiales bacterium]|jgi:MinD-like ATPase involved in chromosome partitioning or flagellar assembly